MQVHRPERAIDDPRDFERALPGASTASMTRASRSEPRPPVAELVGDAERGLSEVVRSTQRLISHRIDLIRLELAQTVRGNVRALALISLAGAIFGLGWIGLMIAVAALLHLALPLWAAAGLISAVHLVAAGVFAVIGAGQAHSPALGVSTDERERAMERLEARTDRSGELKRRLQSRGDGDRSVGEERGWTKATPSSAG